MMSTQIEGLIFAALVLPTALGWLVWYDIWIALNYLKTTNLSPAKKN
jgi:hypothetical protein